MCLMATDLPVPENPMMTMVSPSLTVREKPASTRLGPNALCTSFSSIIGAVLGKGGWSRERIRHGAAANHRLPRVAPWSRELGSGGERPECAADVAFAEALEGAVAELPDALARDAEHGADFLEGVFASAFEAEVEAQHLGVAGRQGVEGLFDLVVRKRFMASSSVSGISSATKRSMRERSPSGSIGASSRTSPVLRAASDWTTSTERPVSWASSSGLGSRRSFWRRIPTP